MYCVNCGKNIEQNNKFCNYCGKKVNEFENSEMAELTIIKNTVSPRGFICTTCGVYIDNEVVVPKLKKMRTTIKVPFGQHNIKVKYRDNFDEVDIFINREYPFIYVYVPLYLSVTNLTLNKIKITSVIEKKNRIVNFKTKF